MTPDVNEFITFFRETGIQLIFKILILMLIGVFAIYNVILVTRVNNLNRTLILSASGASTVVRVTSIILLFASISLFIATLVIV